MTRAEFESLVDALLVAHGDWKEGSKLSPPARAAVLAAWDEMESARDDYKRLMFESDDRAERRLKAKDAAESRLEAAREALRNVADLGRGLEAVSPDDLCWCGDEKWPEEHQPYCEAARDALKEKP